MGYGQVNAIAVFGVRVYGIRVVVAIIVGCIGPKYTAANIGIPATRGGICWCRAWSRGRWRA
jgi:hypothetical protein